MATVGNLAGVYAIENVVNGKRYFRVRAWGTRTLSGIAKTKITFGNA